MTEIACALSYEELLFEYQRVRQGLAQLRRNKVEIAESTMNGWVKGCGENCSALRVASYFDSASFLLDGR